MGILHIGVGGRWVTVGVVIVLVLQITVSSVYSWQFNCDPVNQGQLCLCTKGDNGGASWDIACPAKILEVYPVSLKSEWNENILKFFW